MTTATDAKTITTRAGETFTFDFFCERRRASMTFIGCERMQAAAKREANRPENRTGRHIMSFSVKPMEINPCDGCPQGVEIRTKNHTPRRQAVGAGHAREQTCLWQNCSARVHANGLCQRHNRQLSRNALIRLNTAAAGPAAVHGFLKKLIEMAEDARMPVEDVALAALDEGVRVYFERKNRWKSDTDCTDDADY